MVTASDSVPISRSCFVFTKLLSQDCLREFATIPVFKFPEVTHVESANLI